MSSEVKNFIRKIIFTVIAFAALCIFCFDMFGSTGNSHFGFLALLFPVLGVLFILRNSLQGMGYSLMPMMAGVSELLARSLVCFLLVPVFGYLAAVMASPVAWIFADILLISVYILDMRKLRQKLVPAKGMPA